MSKNYYFTMIIYVDDEDLLERSLNSIFSGNKYLYDRLKLIVVDAVCSEKTKAVSDRCCSVLDSENYVYLSAKDAGIAAAYNLAVPQIRGSYVNFSLASTYFEPGTLECVREVAENNERPKMISLAPITINEKNEVVRYTVSPAISNAMYENIRFYKNPEKLQLMFHAYFFRTFLFNDKDFCREFHEELYDDAVTEVLLTLYAEWRGYYFLPQLSFHYTKQLEDNTSVFSNQYERWWYIDSLEKWILPFERTWSKEKGPLEQAVKSAILYLIFARYNCNYNDRSKGILCDEDLALFLKLTGEALNYIDNMTIFHKPRNRRFEIPRSMRMFFMRIRAEQFDSCVEVVDYNGMLHAWIHPNNEEAIYSGMNDNQKDRFPDPEDLNSLGLSIGESTSLFFADRSASGIPEIEMAFQNDNFIPLGSIEKEQVILSVINYQNGMLEIDGTFSLGDLLEKEQINLKIVQDSKEIPVSFSPVYGLAKLFGKTYYHKYNFHVSVPASFLYGEEVIHFVTDINDQRHILRMRSSKVYAHLREDIKAQYWDINGKWGANIANQVDFKLYRLDDSLKQKKENEYIRELTARSKKGDLAAAHAISLREQYFERAEEFRGRRIWITFDKLYKAGDNGEYIYHYVSAQQDDIEIFYLIKSDSPDYVRLTEQGANVLVWGEDESLITILYAEAILTTHTNVISYVGFEPELIPYICDLFDPVNICIQHGLTVQDIAQFQNRLFDNLQLYLCASFNELENLMRPIYGYADDQVALTGVARYDGLKNNDQRQILITPTWRRNIANSNIAHFKKGHNDNFIHSSYFEIYNSLINDERLIESAKQYGYRIIYLLHPAVSAQIDDYDRNDYVELVQGAGDLNYEKILTESSLMVTDYSGVQFDFAYQRKPILYYHPSALPPHYDQSKAYQYDRDGFGPIITEHEELVDQLCEYMANDCQMKQEYVERANLFFAFNDHNNAERMYEAILEFLDSRRG